MMETFVPYEDPQSTAFYTQLRDELEELFPKKQCKERGAALVLFAHAVMLFQKHANITHE